MARGVTLDRLTAADFTNCYRMPGGGVGVTLRFNTTLWWESIDAFTEWWNVLDDLVEGVNTDGR